MGVSSRTVVEQAEALRSLVQQIDPLLVEAVGDVDRELLRWMLRMTPLERLRAAANGARALAGMRHGAP